jgi:hypothetical protein
MAKGDFSGTRAAAQPSQKIRSMIDGTASAFPSDKQMFFVRTDMPRVFVRVKMSCIERKIVCASDLVLI